MLAEPVGIVFAARDPVEELEHLPDLEVRGLVNGDARALLDSVVRFKLDERVRERIIAEKRGNPLALLEMTRSAPGPGLYRAIERGGTIAMTTAPDELPAGVDARPLDAARRVRFELLWRDETPSPALAEFIRLARESLGGVDTTPRRLRPVA